YTLVGDSGGVAVVLLVLGRIARLRRDYRSARSCFSESIAIWRKIGGGVHLAACLEGVAQVATASGHPQRATRLFAAAETVRATYDAPRPPAAHDAYQQALGTLHAALSEEDFAAAWAEGRALCLEQAVAAALEADDAGSAG